MNETLPSFKRRFINDLNAEAGADLEEKFASSTDDVQVSEDGTIMWADESIDEFGVMSFDGYVAPDTWFDGWVKIDDEYTPVYVFTHGNDKDGRSIIKAEKVETIAGLDGASVEELCDRATVNGSAYESPVRFDLFADGYVVIAPYVISHTQYVYDEKPRTA
jgi:hypothetical protein